MKATRGYASILRSPRSEINDIHFATVKLSVGGDTATAGRVLTRDGETQASTNEAQLVDLCAAGERPFGILIEPIIRPAENWDLDDALADGTLVRMLKCPIPHGVTVALFLDGQAGPIAVVLDDRVCPGAVGGIQPLSAYYTDAAYLTDTVALHIGYADEADAGHATEDRVVLVRG